MTNAPILDGLKVVELSAFVAAPLGGATLASLGAEVIRIAREHNPSIRVLARAPYLRDLPALTAAGADTVFTGEGEVALAFVETILTRLGATAEQMDRERDRAHRDLFGTTTGP